MSKLQNKNNRIICADDLVKNIRSGYIDNFSVRKKKIFIEIIISSGQKKNVKESGNRNLFGTGQGYKNSKSNKYLR